jgi:NAD(P)H-flavin reductase/ferredoxin
MAKSHQITIDGHGFQARRGELLLDAALSNGIDLPYNCRAGHCGTCCVRLVSGEVKGGEGSEPGIVHACQCRIVGDAVLEKDQPSGVRTVEGVVSLLCPLSAEVMEVGIRTDRPLPYHAGQYAQVRFSGYPSRPFSITHPLRGNPNSHSVWFHMRRMKDGRVTRSLGKHIKPGHRVTLTGPYGSAHFRPNLDSRLILVGTNTGFAPIWSIAVAALRENPERMLMIIAGGRTMESLYMVPALVQLARFPNVLVVPVCSARQQTLSEPVKPGRPTDYLPRLLPTDVIYACGAPGMVDSIKSIAAQVGAVCYADPFLPTTDDTVEESVLTRAMGWLAVPTGRQTDQLALDRPRNQREQLILPTTDDMVEERIPTRAATRWLAAPPGRQMGQVPFGRPRNRREQPILPAADDTVEERIPTRGTRWLAAPPGRQMGDRPRNRREQPFLPATDDTLEESVPTRGTRWLAAPPGRKMGPVDLDRPRNQREQRFLPTTDDTVEESAPARATRWIAAPPGRQMGPVDLDRPRNRREQPIPPTTDDTVEESVPGRGTRWLAARPGRQMGEPPLDRPRNRPEQPMQAYRMAQTRVRRHYRS